MPISTRSYAIAATAVAVLGLGGIWIATQRSSGDVFADCRESAIAGGTAAIGGPFTLVDHTGTTVTERDVITGPTLVYFGYSFCPDVCPMDLARNAEAVFQLEEDGYAVKPVFISIDPDRDTPEVLAEYTDIMHPEMVGLTGSADQVQAASRAYRTYFRLHDQSDPYYLVDHSTQSYLMFPATGPGTVFETGFAEYFNRDVSPEDMARRVACFVDAAANA